MLYHHVSTKTDLGHINNIVDMWRVKWLGDGDSHIETFKNEWEFLVDAMPHKTSRNTLAMLLLTQMTKSTVLKSKVDKYHKKYPGEHKNYSKLMAILGIHLTVKHHSLVYKPPHQTWEQQRFALFPKIQCNNNEFN